MTSRCNTIPYTYTNSKLLLRKLCRHTPYQYYTNTIAAPPSYHTNSIPAPYQYNPTPRHSELKKQPYTNTTRIQFYANPNPRPSIPLQYESNSNQIINNNTMPCYGFAMEKYDVGRVMGWRWYVAGMVLVWYRCSVGIVLVWYWYSSGVA